MSITETWNQGIERMAKTYIQEYRDGKPVLESKVKTEILRLYYSIKVQEKKIEPITGSPEEKALHLLKNLQ